MRVCPSCGYLAADDYAFCPKCGSSLAVASSGPPSPVDERRTVTTLFCDQIGFTAISEARRLGAVPALREAEQLIRRA